MTPSKDLWIRFEHPWCEGLFMWESPRIRERDRREGRVSLREHSVSILSRRRARTDGAPDGSPAFNYDEGALKAYPGLLQFLGSDRYDDGSPRERGSITFFVDDVDLKAALNDKDGEASAYVTGGSFKGILDTLEKKIQADTLEWRFWKKQKLTRKSK